MYDNWDELEKSIVDCKKCKLCLNRREIVVSCGDKNADIMFIGDYPSDEDDIHGTAFSSKARRTYVQSVSGDWFK